jgi:hypothetical protein
LQKLNFFRGRFKKVGVKGFVKDRRNVKSGIDFAKLAKEVSLLCFLKVIFFLKRNGSFLPFWMPEGE